MSTPHEYQLTIIDTASLLRRLTTEFGFAVDRARALWPELKQDPIGLTKRSVREWAWTLREFVSTPNRLAALVTSFLLVGCAVIFLFLGGSGRKGMPGPVGTSIDLLEVLNFQAETPQSSDSGIGLNSRGRVGFNDGRGEGSNPIQSKSGGGGGGGMHDPTAAQQGRIPLPSLIPAPIPKLTSTESPTLPAAGIDIDPALWKALPFRNYGDPRSNATIPSNGPGDGGGMGNSTGTGVGVGEGPGVGPGDGGNMGDGPKSIGSRGPGGSNGNHIPEGPGVIPNSKATQRVRILSKPEPQYTEEARRSDVTGTVVLRVVFSSSGEVTNIRTVASLPYGLTEKAIAAARQIKFSPALLNGQPVSVSFQLEYNFSLY